LQLLLVDGGLPVGKGNDQIQTKDEYKSGRGRTEDGRHRKHGESSQSHTGQGIQKKWDGWQNKCWFLPTGKLLV
ncbi:hypothetical protein ABTK11_19990, partial [Acinetobacter baumannii]